MEEEAYGGEYLDEVDHSNFEKSDLFNFQPPSETESKRGSKGVQESTLKFKEQKRNLKSKIVKMDFLLGNVSGVVLPYCY